MRSRLASAAALDVSVAPCELGAERSRAYRTSGAEQSAARISPRIACDKLRGGRRRAQCDAVTFVQRFGDALNLNVHFYSLVLDGVYARDAEGRLRFHSLPPPEDAEVERVARQLARRIVRLLVRRGLGPEADPFEVGPVLDDQPLLAALYAASVAGRAATGRGVGRRTLQVGDRIDAERIAALHGERCASVGGVSLHANVAVPARDRRGLRRLGDQLQVPIVVATDYHGVPSESTLTPLAAFCRGKAVMDARSRGRATSSNGNSIPLPLHSVSVWCLSLAKSFRSLSAYPIRSTCDPM